MKNLNVQLIQAPKSKGYVDNSRTGCYFPLGLISIGTYLKETIPKAEVELFDGELMTTKQIVQRLKPNSLLGIDTKTPTYSSAIEIAKKAKQLGCKVVFGGVYASAIPEIIAKNRKDIVDHVVVGFGEKIFADIINGNQEKIIYNYQPDFNEIPLPNRSAFTNPEDYFNNFQREHPTWGSRGTNIFTHIGCINKCIFCSRQGPKKKVYYKDPNKIWDEITYLVKNYGIDYIVDFSDNINQNLSWLERLAQTKPNHISPAFHVFSTAVGINEKSLGILKRLNAKHLFVGVETGDHELSKYVNKGKYFSPESSLKAVELATKYGFNITPSFVLGLPEESEKSLRNTYDMAKKISEISGFEEIFCSALIPFPGSVAFEMLRRKHNLETDVLDPEELKKLWIKTFCGIDYKTIMEYANRILDLGKYKITIKKNY